MTDLDLLFLVLAAIYLHQCLLWVPADATVFRQGWRGKWRVVRRGLQFAEGKSRGLLAPPLPPLQGLTACEPWPLALSPLGFAAPESPPKAMLRPHQPEPRQFRWSEVQLIVPGDKKICVDDQMSLLMGSPAAAQHWAHLLESLRRMTPQQREAELQREFARQFSTEAVAARLAAWREGSFNLRLACNSLFAVLFAIAPVHVWRQMIAHTWPLLVAYLVAHAILITWLFRRFHRSLYPEESEARWTNTLLILVSPPVAVRALDVVQRDLFHSYHPAAVAAVLCDHAEARRVAGRALRELRYPLPAASDPEDGIRRETEDWFRVHLGQALEKFLLANGMPPGELLSPPQRLSDRCVTYCPRCCNQFVVEAGTCSDCPGVTLLHFSPATHAAGM